MALGRTAKYYRDNPEARKKKAKTDAKVNRKPEQVKKRVEANKARRDAEKAGHDIKGKDYDHAVGRFVKSKTNRGRAGEGGRKRGPNKRKGPK
jgi:hypothetical protein